MCSAWHCSRVMMCISIATLNHMSIVIAVIIALLFQIVYSRENWRFMMGRPPVPTHLKRDKRLVVMLTDEESVLLGEVAKASGAASVSDWVRETLLSAASLIGK